MAIVKRRRVSTASSDLGKLGSGVNCNNSNSIKEINPSNKNNQEKSKNSDVVESLDSNLKNTETVKKMKMVCGSFYFPKDNPAKPLGEDAHFICEAAQTIGVADGVGSWSKKGVDAGEYARTLMTNASLAAQKIHNTRKRKAVDFESGTEIRAVDPLIVLEEAFEKTKENLELQGSSTACIVSFDRENRVLRAANVGDSGFVVLRRHRTLFASPAMQHRFNCPYKLGNGERNDGPQSAHAMVLKALEAGDIIVMGTDGLFDNMFPEQIEEILEATEDRRVDEELNDSGEYCEMVASVLADIALENSMDPEFDSPFSKEAARYGMLHNGGKMDDITVVVAQIVAS